MSKRAEELAEGFAHAVAEFKSCVREIPDEAWARPVSSGDPRGVGVVARHVVWAYEFEWEYFRAIADGHPLAPVPEFDSINAEYAEEWKSISMAEVLAALQSAEAVVNQIRGLTDEQLAREGQFVAARPSRSVDEWVGRALPTHIRNHMHAMQAAITA
jgi:hypothetical protein